MSQQHHGQEAGEGNSSHGGCGRNLRDFLQFHPLMFEGQPNLELARSWIDGMERVFRSMECVEDEKDLLASY